MRRTVQGNYLALTLCGKNFWPRKFTNMARLSRAIDRWLLNVKCNGECQFVSFDSKFDLRNFFNAFWVAMESSLTIVLIWSNLKFKFWITISEYRKYRGSRTSLPNSDGNCSLCKAASLFPVTVRRMATTNGAGQLHCSSGLAKSEKFGLHNKTYRYTRALPNRIQIDQLG